MGTQFIEEFESQQNQEKNGNEYEVYFQFIFIIYKQCTFIHLCYFIFILFIYINFQLFSCNILTNIWCKRGKKKEDENIQ